MEEYDRSGRQAMRIEIELPAPCKHEFCRSCLDKMFARRKRQDGVNLCPICRAVWFEAEYEGSETRARRLAADRTGQIPGLFRGFPPAGPGFSPCPSFGPAIGLGGSGNNSGASISEPASPLCERTSRPYHRNGEREPQAARPTASTSNAADPSDWLNQPAYLYREVHKAIAADRARNMSSQPGSTTRPLFPYIGDAHPSMPLPGRSGMRQPTGDRAQRNHTADPINIPPKEKRNQPRAERSCAVPPQTTKEKEIFRRETVLNAREAELKQGEDRL